MSTTADTSDTQQQINEQNRQLASAKNKRTSLQQQIEEINRIYWRLNTDRSSAAGYRDKARNLRDESYVSFQGEVHTKTYVPNMKKVTNHFDKMVSSIDSTMAELKRLEDEYKKELSSCNSLIARLQQLIEDLINDSESSTA